MTFKFVTERTGSRAVGDAAAAATLRPLVGAGNKSKTGDPGRRDLAVAYFTCKVLSAWRCRMSVLGRMSIRLGLRRLRTRLLAPQQS